MVAGCDGGVAGWVVENDAVLIGDEVERDCLLRALSRRANIISRLVFIGSGVQFSLVLEFASDADGTGAAASCVCISLCIASLPVSATLASSSI